MVSFRLLAKGISSASLSVTSTRSLTLSLRRRAAALSSRRSSGGMRSTTAPAAPGIALRRRPLGENGTPKRSARSATATSFRFDSRRATSRTTARLSGRHADEDARAVGDGSASSQTASTIARASAELLEIQRGPDGSALGQRERAGGGRRADAGVRGVDWNGACQPRKTLGVEAVSVTVVPGAKRKEHESPDRRGQCVCRRTAREQDDCPCQVGGAHRDRARCLRSRSTQQARRGRCTYRRYSGSSARPGASFSRPGGRR